MAATAIASAFVTIVPSMKGFKGKLEDEIGVSATAVGDDAGKKMGGGLASGLKSMIGPIVGVLSAVAIGSFIKDSVAAASDLNEAGTAVAAVFGDASKEIDKWASGAANALGQSKIQALNAAKTFGIYGQSAGLSAQENAKFSQSLTGLATDFASFYNASPQEAIDAIGAALRGEAEPIRRFGILLDDATLKNEALKLGLISTTKDALTPQQRVLAAQSAIMSQAGAAMGDFERTSLGLANQQRILAAQWENVKASIGTVFLPFVNMAIQALNGFLTAITPVMQAVALFGTHLSNVFQLAGGGAAGFQAMLASIGDSVTKFITGGGLAEAFMSLSTMRTQLMNSIIMALPGIIDGFVTFLPQLTDFIVTQFIPGMVNQFVGLITQIMAVIQTSLPQLIDGLAVAIPQIVQQIANMLPDIVSTLLGMIPTLLTTALTLFNSLIDAVITIFPQLINTIVNMMPSLVESIVSMLPDIITAALNLFMGIVEGLIQAIPVLLNTILGALPTIITTILGMLPDIIQAAIDLFMGLVLGLVDMLPDLLDTLINDVLPNLLTTLAEMLPDIIQGAIDLFLGILTGLVDAIPDILTGLIDMLPQLLETLVGMLPKIIMGAIELFLGIVTGLVKAIPDIIKALIEMIPKLVKALIDCLPQLIDAGWQLLQGLGKGITDDLPRYAAKLAKMIGDAITGGVKAIFGIKSPSRVFYGIGGYIIAGLVNGLSDGQSQLEKAVDTIGSVVDSAFGTYSGSISANATIGATTPNVSSPATNLAAIASAGSSQTVNYYAAPNQSVDSEQALFTALQRAKVLTAW